jgi:hypothetical protein
MSWIGRSGDGSERRYSDDEAARNRALDDTFGDALRRYKVTEWLKGATDAHPTLAELQAEGYEVVKTEDGATKYPPPSWPVENQP